MIAHHTYGLIRVFRYLFASAKTIKQLEKTAAQRGKRGLLSLFPNLTILVSRLSPITATPQIAKVYGQTTRKVILLQ